MSKETPVLEKSKSMPQRTDSNPPQGTNRRELRGHRIDYTKLCKSKTLCGQLCHQCRTQITEDEENICSNFTNVSTDIASAGDLGSTGKVAQSRSCKQRFCNDCLEIYMNSKADK